MSTFMVKNRKTKGTDAFVEFPFDRVLTPLALSIALQEGKLGVVGFQFQLFPKSQAGSPAVLEGSVPRAQSSFRRIQS